MRHAWRDYFRRRRVDAHVRGNGDRFTYHGIAVEVPKQAGLGVRNAILRRKYEADEAAMILKHLPLDLPVIELGGSLGLVSALIRSRLAPGVRHLVVEANPEIIAICGANACRNAEGCTDVLHAALYYDGPVARLAIDPDVHSSVLGDGGARTVEVPAVTLAALHERIGAPEHFALVSDIEGGELPIFTRSDPALASAQVIIAELHDQAYRGAGSSERQVLEQCEALGFKLVDRQADVVVLKRSA